MIGPVPKAGRLEITGDETILEALTLAGWSYGASPARRLSVIRDGRIAILDLRALMVERKLELNLRVRTGDILVLMEGDPVRVTGNVQTPGPLPVGGKGFLTVREALTLAGGLKPGSDLSQAELLRRDGTLLRVDLNQYLFADLKDQLLIYPGESLMVPTYTSAGVYVFGMVEKPGLHKFQERPTVSKALALASPNKFGAVLSSVRVVKGYPSTPKVYAVDAERLFDGDASQDMVLGDGDVVFVPESTASDVLDFLGRFFAPLSVGTRVVTESLLIREILRDKD